VGKDQSAGRPGQDGHAEDREDGEQAGDRVDSREDGGDDRGEPTVEGKVVPLDEALSPPVAGDSALADHISSW